MIPANPYFNPKPYVAASISEIYDQIGGMILNAPTFTDPLGQFDWNIDNEFTRLIESFSLVRVKIGENRYIELVELADRAKSLFAADQDNTNGKTNEGRKLLFKIEDRLNEVSRHRKQAKLPDDEGSITGD